MTETKKVTEAETEEKESETNSVKTGDDTPIELYVVLLVAALIVIAGFGFRRRRRIK